MLPSRLAIPGNMTLRAWFWWTTVVFWMAAIYLASSIPSVATLFEPVFDFTAKKLAHIAEYAVLTFLLFNALRNHIVLRARAALTAALIATLYAFTDEWHQTFVPGRLGTLYDVGIDALGAIAVSVRLSKSVRDPANPGGKLIPLETK
jgi:VanZ family protein